MQLFDNFDNIPSNYIPNNMFPPIPQIMVEVDDDTVHPIFRDGKLKGYWWHWGDSISLPIKNQLHINIPAQAIVVYNSGEKPTYETVGTFVGQKYYNLADLQSWTLTAIVPDMIEENIPAYSWTKDNKLTYPKCGANTTPVDILIPLKEHEQIVVQMFNFRKERMFTEIYTEPEFTWTLSADDSLKLQPGIYFFNVHLESRYEQITSDLRLTNAYEIVVKGF